MEIKNKLRVTRGGEWDNWEKKRKEGEVKELYIKDPRTKTMEGGLNMGGG